MKGSFWKNFTKMIVEAHGLWYNTQRAPLRRRHEIPAKKG